MCGIFAVGRRKIPCHACIAVQGGTAHIAAVAGSAQFVGTRLHPEMRRQQGTLVVLPSGYSTVKRLALPYPPRAFPNTRVRI